jgi:hypothetical protein
VYLDRLNSNGTNPFGLKKKKKKTGVPVNEKVQLSEVNYPVYKPTGISEH